VKGRKSNRVAKEERLPREGGTQKPTLTRNPGEKACFGKKKKKEYDGAKEFC